MPGMHGSYTAVTSMQKADLLITLGARFDDRITGKVSSFAPEAKVIHVDIDPAELGKVRRPDVPIVGDCKSVIADLVKALRSKMDEAPRLERTAWNSQIEQWRRQYPYRYDRSDPSVLKPQFVVEMLYQGTGGDAILCAGVGQHQMYASQYWRFNRPYTWINSGGLGTMGFAIPAAIGAKVGRPDEKVWAIDGDGCFQMTAQELITASTERIPVKIAILNNSYLGMVRQWQELFYSERYSEVYLSQDIPDYVKWAEAMGCVGFRVDAPEDALPTIEKAHEIEDRPVVIDFRVDPTEKVYPMVPAGESNDKIILGPETDWTEGAHHALPGLESEEQQ
jgi:acetolactate synthase-1/2/3 large subunit